MRISYILYLFYIIHFLFIQIKGRIQLRKYKQQNDYFGQYFPPVRLYIDDVEKIVSIINETDTEANPHPIHEGPSIYTYSTYEGNSVEDIQYPHDKYFESINIVSPSESIQFSMSLGANRSKDLTILYVKNINPEHKIAFEKIRDIVLKRKVNLILPYFVNWIAPILIVLAFDRVSNYLSMNILWTVLYWIAAYAVSATPSLFLRSLFTDRIYTYSSKDSTKGANNKNSQSVTLHFEKPEYEPANPNYSYWNAIFPEFKNFPIEYQKEILDIALENKDRDIFEVLKDLYSWNSFPIEPIGPKELESLVREEEYKSVEIDGKKAKLVSIYVGIVEFQIIFYESTFPIKVEIYKKDQIAFTGFIDSNVKYSEEIKDSYQTWSYNSFQYLDSTNWENCFSMLRLLYLKRYKAFEDEMEIERKAKTEKLKEKKISDLEIK